MNASDDVVEIARRGDPAAWKQLYDELAPRLLGFLRARGAVDPEDLLAETFLQIVRDLPRFSGDASAFRAWAFTIAHRRVIDAARRRTTAHAALPRLVRDHDEVGGDVEQEALEALSESELLAALETLSQEQRTVLLLRVFADLTIPEIAAIVEKRQGAVKALQRRALASLKRALSREAVPL